MNKQSRERRVTFLICLLMLFSVVLGCRQLGRRNRTSSLTNRNSNSGSGKTGDTLLEKNNLYISKCVNKYSNSVMNSYRRYASWLHDIDQGPTGKETLVYGLYDISGDGQDCADAITKAKGMEPPIADLETAADQYITALKSAIVQVKGIYPYYNHGDYKDDGFQKGRAAHPALLAAFKNFQQANKNFDTEVDKLEDSVLNKRLNDLKGNAAKKYEYAIVNTSIRSKNILRLVKNTEYPQLKAEDLQPLIEEFEKAVDELKTAGSGKSLSSFYVSACDEFLTASKELMRRVRDKKPFNDFERRQLGTSGGWMVDGSPDKLVNKYNDMASRRGMAG